MALPESSARRSDDAVGKEIKTFLDGTDHIQAIALVDDAGDQTGIAGSELQVDVVASGLPAGSATSAAQAILLVELQLKADLTETQPVSAAALPLPAGSATAVAQAALLAELQLKADLTESQPVNDNAGSLTVDQATHDNLQVNANIQVNDVDVGAGNLVPVDVANNVAAAFDHGSNSAIGVGATQFIVASVPAVLGVEVKAANGNTANIYVGNADVTAATVDATDGMELGPGESILVRIDDVNKLYAISLVSPQRVFWLVV